MGLRSLGQEHPLRFPNQNGLGYYMYMPSLVLDGDLDFRNQAALSLGSSEAPRWLVSGRYPMGVAISLTPSFLVAHAFSRGLHALTGSHVFAPDGFTLLYQVLNLVVNWLIADAMAPTVSPLWKLNTCEPPFPVTCMVIFSEIVPPAKECRALSALAVTFTLTPSVPALGIRAPKIRVLAISVLDTPEV